MLPRLDEDPPDPRDVIEQFPETKPPPKHPILLFLVYLLLGFILCLTVCIIGGWLILSYFRMDIKSFILHTKSDVYHLMSTQQPSPTPSPAATSWNTYTNLLQHYTIMYPPGWTAQQDTDNTVILYPPSSREFESLTIGDIGGGIGPKILITTITREFMPPTNPQTFTTDSHITGYSYVADQNTPDIPNIDFPLDKNKEILEFSVHHVGQQNIQNFLKLHKSTLQVQDIDSTTYNNIAKSLQFINQ